MSTNPTDTGKPVVFLLNGQEVSNSPGFGAAEMQKQREEADANLRRMEEEVDAAKVAQAAVKASEEGQHTKVEDLSALDGKALKALAASRGVDIEGVKTKKALIAKLHAVDKSGAARPDLEFTGQDAALIPGVDAPPPATPVAVVDDSDDDDDEDDDEE